MAAPDIPARSLGGCSTCRVRHLKCDETKPTCRTCRRMGVTCDGYLNRITFVLMGKPEAATAESQSRFRRPIYTEVERHIMSEELVASLGVMSASQCLNNIDAENLASGVSASIVKFFGPFGVFSLTQDVAEEDYGALPLAEEVSDHGPLVSDTFVQSPRYDDTLPFDISDSLDASGLLDMTLWGDITEVPGIDSGAKTGAAEKMTAGLTTQPGDSFCYVNTPFTAPWLGSDTTFPVSPPSPQLPRELSAMSEDFVPRDAPLLLSHYMENVIPLLSPILHRKNSPWDILHLKSAMQTLSQLSMRVACNYAQLTIFCAVLATSCFHRASSSDGDMGEKWSRSAKDYFANALEFLKLSLKNEVNQARPKKAKYKEILTAILAVVNVGIFNADIDNTRSLLLDAERFIRLCGLPKARRSRKVRLLHHCYAFSRIFYESVSSVACNDTTTDSHLSIEDTRADRFRSSIFRVPSWEGTFETAMALPKDMDLGHNDLHLETPGQWDPTMYPDIYGIPEDFLLLLSQVTRLGNEKDIIQYSRSDTVVNWAHVANRAKTLEKCVLKWQPDTPEHSTPGTALSSLVASNKRVIQHHLLAMQQALIIFFYRRIRDLDPSMLQDKVLATINHLEACHMEDSHNRTFTVTFVWPAFIGACEALDSNTQDRYARYFDVCYTRSHLATFLRAKNIVKEVWAKRMNSMNEDVDWLQLSREQRLQSICF